VSYLRNQSTGRERSELANCCSVSADRQSDSLRHACMQRSFSSFVPQS